MSDRPILFSAPMVRAILAGTKIQTRRVAGLHELRPSSTPGYDWTWRGRAPIRSVAQQRRHPGGCWQDVSTAGLLRLCPYGVPGDTLWVRETWGQAGAGEEWDYHRGKADSSLPVLYRADDPTHGADDEFWRPSIHMPRWASRLSLRVTEVRVECVQGISDADARAEGVGASDGAAPTGWARHNFAALWDSINNKREGASWDANPWVWAVSFERVSP